MKLKIFHCAIRIFIFASVYFLDWRSLNTLFIIRKKIISTVPVLLVILFSFGCISAQQTNLGFPSVTNHSKKEMNSGTQTWDITVDNRGYTYFANNGGLLVFDGYIWENHPITNNTVIRSVAVGPDERIYVGGQGDLGYFSPDQVGRLYYTSLISIQNKPISFEDVWDIVVNKDGVFFRTDFYVFKYNFKDKLETVFYSENSLLFIGQWRDKLVIQDGRNVLFEFNDNKFSERKKNTIFDKGRISAVINYTNDTLLITTIDKGIFYEANNNYFQWKTKDDNFLRKNIIFTATQFPSGELVLGTSFNGVIILDKERRITQHLNKKHGLQNNTVLSSLVTSDGNVWLGLDNGIDMVDLTGPFRHFFPDESLEGTGYTAKVHDGMLYFGTNTGLYTLPWKKYYDRNEKEKAQLVSGTEGQVWSLNEINDQLLVGHHSGAFAIHKTQSTKFTNIMGVWKFEPISDELALAGHYKGLAMFERIGNTWKFKYQINGFNESSRIIAKDANHNIWVAHPYRGVFMFDKKEILKETTSPIKYTSINSSAKVFRNVFYTLGQDILLDDGKNLYKYNYQTKAADAFNDLKEYLPTQSPLKFLIPDAFGHIWFGNAISTSLLMKESLFNASFKKYDVNEIAGMLPSGFESVYTIDPQNVIFPSEKGFLFLNPSHLGYDTVDFKLMLSKVQLHTPKDSTLFTGHKRIDNQLPSFNIAHFENKISIYLTVNTSGNKEFVQYSYSLDKGRNWSEWSNDSQITFTQLPSGKYTLYVKAKKPSGKVSQQIKVNFFIGYPWYRTFWAYSLYISICLLFGYILYNKQTQRHENEKNTLVANNKLREEEHLVKAEASKDEITRLQNEKLLAELNFKNQELTSFTYHLVNKNELITEITDVVNKLDQKLNDKPDIRKELKQIIKLTEKNIDVDADWQNFIKSFDEVHTNFYKRLNETYKDLSPNDYKMCTYLRMNLTTKEIASLMNISIRSVETNRYRLRKKLDLDSETNLSQFLMNY
ncbi:MAG: hypothetical protein IPN86_16485 [Saprospiraceae bacterium]|nr:hypothetical protein [Saprospiraceae bacterium]